MTWLGAPHLAVRCSTGYRKRKKSANRQDNYVAVTLMKELGRWKYINEAMVVRENDGDGSNA